jgi:hypothetical protein
MRVPVFPRRTLVATVLGQRFETPWFLGPVFCVVNIDRFGVALVAGVQCVCPEITLNERRACCGYSTYTATRVWGGDNPQFGGFW